MDTLPGNLGILPERSLFVPHIRKTAGVSVRTALFNRFAVRDCLLDCHHVSNQGVDPGSYRFVTGHVGFDYVQRFSRRPVIFAVLRQPKELALSAYHFYRSNSPSFLQWLQDTIPAEVSAQRVRFTQRANELTPLEFLEQESALAQTWLGNTQTRVLAGSVPARGAQTDEALLEQAIRNLESCDIVGLTERLDESLTALEHRLGWEGLGPAPRENVAQDRPAAEDIDPRARDILARWNNLDAELYQAAQRLFARGLEALDRERQKDCQGFKAPDAAAFTFDQAIHGRGWYPREWHEQGWLCWMGTEREAWLDLQVQHAGEHVLQCKGVRVLRPSVLDGLQLRVNGHPLVVAKHGHGCNGLTLEAKVPARLLDPNKKRMRLTFAVADTIRPSDLDPGIPDRRTLGIALDSIHLTVAPHGRVLNRDRRH